MEVLWIVLGIAMVVIIVWVSYKNDIVRRGDKTTGTVTNVDSHVTTDQYGRQHTTYYIRYQFLDKNGRTYNGETSVGSRSCRVGQTINVYYLPDRPERNQARL